MNLKYDYLWSHNLGKGAVTITKEEVNKWLNKIQPDIKNVVAFHQGFDRVGVPASCTILYESYEEKLHEEKLHEDEPSETIDIPVRDNSESKPEAQQVQARAKSLSEAYEGLVKEQP